MIQLKKVPVGIYIAIGSALIFILLIFLLINSLNPMKGRNVMERDFNKNKESILIVKDYLVGFELDSATIRDTSGTMTRTLLDGSIPIEDDRVIEAIRLLLKNGYKSISKRDGCVIFKKWRRMESASGAVYSINGRTPTSSDGRASISPAIQFLTKIEQMSEDGWYYYEENYNEWRIRNPQ